MWGLTRSKIRSMKKNQLVSFKEANRLKQTSRQQTADKPRTVSKDVTYRCLVQLGDRSSLTSAGGSGRPSARTAAQSTGPDASVLDRLVYLLAKSSGCNNPTILLPCVLTLSLSSSKSKFSQPCKDNFISEGSENW